MSNSEAGGQGSRTTVTGPVSGDTGGGQSGVHGTVPARGQSRTGCCGRAGCAHHESEHYGHPDARLCLLDDCECHAFIPSTATGTAGPFGAAVNVTLGSPAGAGSVAGTITIPADEKVAEQVRRSRPSVIQLNAHLVAQVCDTGWTATANLGLGLVTRHVSRSPGEAILGALKLALAELEARHA